MNNNAIHAEDRKGVLTVQSPKRAEAKLKQVKVQVSDSQK